MSFTSSQSFFHGVHALRGFAALLVLFQHAVYFALIFRGESYVNEFPINYGRLGVVLFFSISGFVIVQQRRTTIKDFLTHRLLRIYPTFWMAIAITVVIVGWAWPSAGALFNTLLLLPTSIDPGLVIPNWTLIFEVAFYAVAATVFAVNLSDRQLTIFFLSWIVAINIFGGDAIDSVDFAFPGIKILTSPVMQVLPMGALVGLHADRLARYPRSMIFIVSSVFYLSSFYYPDFTNERHLMMGIATSLAVGGVAGIEWRSRITDTLGDASYGLYLIHMPLMASLQLITPTSSFVAAFSFLFVGALLIGLVFGLLDKFSYRKLRQLIK